MLSCKQTSG